jgi:molybdopterin/thiamine biosynthesis adenylyltransferase/rhodanese-related sulfurtransferase
MSDVLSADEKSRFARHIILDDVGIKGQERLKKASVLCVGTGGLGSPLLLYLSAAGVGKIGIIDFDRVDASNLQRQILHGTSSIGDLKVDSAKKRLEDLNPFTTYQTYDTALTAENALEIFTNYDVIVDGTDNYATRYLVNDACVILGKPNVYGSIFLFEGQATVFNYKGGPNYRDLFPEPPPPGWVPSCAEAGVLGVLPGIIGTIQATETLKIILEKGETLCGRLLLYSALEMRFREVKIKADPLAKPITELIDYEFFCGLKTNAPQAVQSHFQSVSAKEVATKQASGWQPYVLDVRKSSEADIVSFSFVDRLHPHDQIQEIIAELPKDRDILVHCKMGGRSAKACHTLADAGFEHLFNLEGGITAWAQDIDSSLPVY